MIFNNPTLAFIEGAVIATIVVWLLCWRYIKLFKRDI